MTIPIHPKTVLGAVALNIQDLPLVTSFYTEIIGLAIIKQEENRIYLSANGENEPLIILQKQEHAVLKRRRGAGLYHLAILVPTRESLSSFLRHLITTRYPITGASDHDFSEAIYLSDPEGNGIEVYADRPREKWHRTEEGYLNAPTNALDAEALLSLSENGTFKGMPIGTVMGHIHLHVSQLEESERFYIDILGFTKNFADEMRNRFMGQFVSAGGYHHHIGFNIWNGNNAPKLEKHATGIMYFTILLPNVFEYHTVKTRLKNENIVLSEGTDGIFLEDPSGIGIRITHK
ncbi:VOC family protein [Caldibacillus lycopersici]|uniref:VOC family protein n=1 Tax=Perspicuibacillus lycopersici TaxID=1325689 RepID=A0AAE3IUY1_9BACI|nr:VOC family protein [Perspicuibacillus lycopersici]MCU9614672.1 VOC family protein [Perspicuibacillus lycopersici]